MFFFLHTKSPIYQKATNKQKNLKKLWNHTKKERGIVTNNELRNKFNIKRT